jgi:hypothetical protein
VKRPLNRDFAGNQRQANQFDGGGHQEAESLQDRRLLPARYLGRGCRNSAARSGVGGMLRLALLSDRLRRQSGNSPMRSREDVYWPSLDGGKFKPLHPRMLQGRSSSQTHPHFILVLGRESSSNSTRLLARLVLLKTAENNLDCKFVISLRLSNITLGKLYPFPVHGTIRLQRLSHFLPYKAFFSGHDTQWPWLRAPYLYALYVACH